MNHAIEVNNLTKYYGDLLPLLLVLFLVLAARLHHRSQVLGY